METPKITKDEFEKFVPVAHSSNDNLFNNISLSFDSTYVTIVNSFLGDTIGESIANMSADLIADVNRMICILSFMKKIRTNDVVLTSTGFGVVSNTNVAPASTARVDALNKEIGNDLDDAVDILITHLVQTEVWGYTEQAHNIINNLCYKKSIFSLFGSNAQQLDHDKWMLIKVSLIHISQMLCSVISSEYMTYLLDKIRTNTLSDDADKKIVLLGQKYMILSASGFSTDMIAEDIINTLENDIDSYSCYASSKVYTARHQTNYTNEAEDPTYFF